MAKEKKEEKETKVRAENVLTHLDLDLKKKTLVLTFNAVVRTIEIEVDTDTVKQLREDLYFRKIGKKQDFDTAAETD